MEMAAGEREELLQTLQPPGRSSVLPLQMSPVFPGVNSDSPKAACSELPNKDRVSRIRARGIPFES